MIDRSAVKVPGSAGKPARKQEFNAEAQRSQRSKDFWRFARPHVEAARETREFVLCDPAPLRCILACFRLNQRPGCITAMPRPPRATMCECGSPLREGDGGRGRRVGRFGAILAPTPPPNPLPQGEGENSLPRAHHMPRETNSSRTPSRPSISAAPRKFGTRNTRILAIEVSKTPSAAAPSASLHR